MAGSKETETVSTSLIRTTPRIPLSSKDKKNFCLGMVGWCPCDDCQSVAKKPVEESVTNGVKTVRKSLKLKRKQDSANELTKGDSLEPCNKAIKGDVSQWFTFEVMSDELNKLKEGDCPANTLKNNMWALKTFKEWRVTRNTRYPADPCPEEILVTDNKQILCEWLCNFISEARKANGEEYTPCSLYLILAGLQRHIRQVKVSEEINIFQDVAFKSLRNVCDSIFKRLHSKGIGTEAKATPVMSVNEEDVLWNKKILDLDTPIGLLQAVFFS